MLAQLRYATGDAMNGGAPVLPAVPGLCYSIRPSTIFRAVTKLIINPVNRLSGGAFTHVRKEILKQLPSLAQRNPSPSIIGKGLIFWVHATLLHAQPNHVGFCFGKSMSGRIGNQLVSMKAATGTSISRSKRLVKNLFLISAFAGAKGLTLASPIWSLIARFGKHFKPSKGFSDQGYFRGHDVGSFNVVLSGGRSVATDAHCAILPQFTERIN